ncbi:unnamed protein product [Soboliphyme baturini]|uniref:Uncharacterized protein n=1 Tax=Soboliphyme baturini TaxID=241478 RepID=A0A183IRP1_9BILA|nr:unnamed protein product [Soboliphyme baturini]
MIDSGATAVRGTGGSWRADSKTTSASVNAHRVTTEQAMKQRAKNYFSQLGRANLSPVEDRMRNGDESQIPPCQEIMGWWWGARLPKDSRFLSKAPVSREELCVALCPLHRRGRLPASRRSNRHKLMDPLERVVNSTEICHSASYAKPYVIAGRTEPHVLKRRQGISKSRGCVILTDCLNITTASPSVGGGTPRTYGGGRV